MSNYCECHINIRCEWCEITKQNEIYRKALEFYADYRNYDRRYEGGHESMVDIDGGHRATLALEELE